MSLKKYHPTITEQDTLLMMLLRNRFITEGKHDYIYGIYALCGHRGAV